MNSLEEYGLGGKESAIFPTVSSHILRSSSSMYVS